MPAVCELIPWRFPVGGADGGWRGHTGGLTNPRPWRGRYWASYSNTGGPLLPRKRAHSKKIHNWRELFCMYISHLETSIQIKICLCWTDLVNIKQFILCRVSSWLGTAYYFYLFTPKCLFKLDIITVGILKDFESLDPPSPNSSSHFQLLFTCIYLNI